MDDHYFIGRKCYKLDTTYLKRYYIAKKNKMLTGFIKETLCRSTTGMFHQNCKAFADGYSMSMRGAMRSVHGMGVPRNSDEVTADASVNWIANLNNALPAGALQELWNGYI